MSGHSGWLWPFLAQDAADILAHGQPGLGVQRGEGFIQQQHLGVQRQGADQAAR